MSERKLLFTIIKKDSEAEPEIGQKDFHGDEITFTGINKIEAKKIFCSETFNDPSITQIPIDIQLDYRLKIEIINAAGHFVGYSTEIYGTSIFLNKRIPRTYLKGISRIRITIPFVGEQVVFQGKILGDLFDPHRIIIIKQSGGSTQLSHWLNAYDKLIKKRLNQAA